MKKFKRTNGRLIGVRIAFLGYLLLMGGVLLNGFTNAMFNDIEYVKGSLHVSWPVDDEEDSWDKSSLRFNGQGGACGNIWATIQNGQGSEPMNGPSTYEVYFAEKGNPKNGEKVGEGEVPPLENGETATLTFTAERDGNYKFKAYQRPGHPGKGELWSETVEVKDCGGNESNVEEPKEETVPQKDEGEGTDEGKQTEDKQAEDKQDEEKQKPVNEETGENPASGDKQEKEGGNTDTASETEGHSDDSGNKDPDTGYTEENGHEKDSTGESDEGEPAGEDSP